MVLSLFGDVYANLWISFWIRYLVQFSKAWVALKVETFRQTIASTQGNVKGKAKATGHPRLFSFFHGGHFFEVQMVQRRNYPNVPHFIILLYLIIFIYSFKHSHASWEVSLTLLPFWWKQNALDKWWKYSVLVVIQAFFLKIKLQKCKLCDIKWRPPPFGRGGMWGFPQEQEKWFASKYLTISDIFIKEKCRKTRFLGSVLSGKTKKIEQLPKTVWMVCFFSSNHFRNRKNFMLGIFVGLAFF